MQKRSLNLKNQNKEEIFWKNWLLIIQRGKIYVI